MLVEEFCSKHPDLREAPRKEWLRKDMFKHLLYNDDKKILFCYVPKGEDKGTDFLTLAYIRMYVRVYFGAGNC